MPENFEVPLDFHSGWIGQRSLQVVLASLFNQARRVDSVEGSSVMFWEVFFSAGGANTCAEGLSL